MAEFRTNENGEVVKVELVEQQSVVDVAGLEARVSELEGQVQTAVQTVEDAQASKADLESQLETAKSDLEGVRAVVPAPEEVADEESDGDVAESDTESGEEAPQF